MSDEPTLSTERVALTTERVKDKDRLFKVLYSLNRRGHLPEFCGYDNDGRPLLVWLDESGGDDVIGQALVLGGESAEVSLPMPTDWDDLTYPLRLVTSLS